MLGILIRSATLAALVTGMAAAVGASPQKAPAPRVNPDAAVMQDFVKRVEAYVALHRKLESTGPKLPEQTTPAVVDGHQRALSRLIQEARKNAKPAELLTPAMQRRIRTLLKPIFAGPDGKQIKAEILDNEYTGSVRLAVNARYPDEIPISTVPPQVLAALPKLPEEIEYRFIQNRLILFDGHAHLIIDFMDRAFF